MSKAFLIGTEYEPFEKDFRRAIATTWEAIASDVEDSGYFDGELMSIVEITLDANHVETYGGLTGEKEVAWKIFYRKGHALRKALAIDVLKDYA